MGPQTRGKSRTAAPLCCVQCINKCDRGCVLDKYQGPVFSVGSKTRLWYWLEEGGGALGCISGAMRWGLKGGAGFCVVSGTWAASSPGHFRGACQFPVAAVINDQQLGCLKFKSKYFFFLILEVRCLRLRFCRLIPSGFWDRIHSPLCPGFWQPPAIPGGPWLSDRSFQSSPPHTALSYDSVCPSLSLVRTLSLNAGPHLIQYDLQRPYFQTRPWSGWKGCGVRY